MTLIAVGASTWASGSQVWNGNIGILIANPTKSQTQTSFTALMPRIVAPFAVHATRMSSGIEKARVTAWPSISSVGSQFK